MEVTLSAEFLTWWRNRLARGVHIIFYFCVLLLQGSSSWFMRVHRAQGNCVLSFMWKCSSCPRRAPDLNPIAHFRDELGHWLWARPYHPTLTNALVAEWEQNPCSQVPQPCKKSSQRRGGGYIIAHGLKNESKVKIFWEYDFSFAHFWV